MKRWLKRIFVAVGILAVVLVGFIASNQLDSQTVSGSMENEGLSTIKPGWEGNAVDQDGRFVNDEFPFLPKMTDLLKWQLGGNTFREEKQADTWRPQVMDPAEFLASDRDGILWLGHASFYVRVGGVAILTDPIFGKPPLVKRFVDVPSPLEKIKTVDYILLSHDHRDHMDETTLRAVTEKFRQARILAGLRSEDVLGDWKQPTNSLQTAGWFQEFELKDDRLRVYFLPVRHWSRRRLADTNWRLWGGYIVQTPKATIYFSGDSGYGRHYREMAELFPKIDYFLIGIGSYEPRWFMEPNHNNPAEAVRAFQDAGARWLIPMHYGTFDLSDEPPGQPLRLLKEEATKAGITDQLRPLAIGESLDIE
jgi:L-ascorbate metabolism protein UlaG (beta-lactamase superfamily)